MFGHKIAKTHKIVYEPHHFVDKTALCVDKYFLPDRLN